MFIETPKGVSIQRRKKCTTNTTEMKNASSSLNALAETSITTAATSQKKLDLKTTTANTTTIQMAIKTTTLINFLKRDNQTTTAVADANKSVQAVLRTIKEKDVVSTFSDAAKIKR